MLHRYRGETLLCWVLGAATVIGLCGACSPEQYKADADKEVYEIIDDKWEDDFGNKSNYMIADSNVPASPNDIEIEKVVPPSGILSLSQAVAIATAHNRDYLRQKEQLYLTALDLTLTRHQFARRWFGTIDASYARNSADESVGSDSRVGFNQLLADGAQIGANVAVDWARFLTGDPRSSLGSVLTATVSQPLLRGRGRKIVQENLTQAERNALYQLRAFARYRKTFVVSIVGAYYRVLQQKRNVLNDESSYRRLVESQKRLELEAEAGLASQSDVDEAKQRTLSAENSWVQSQQSYEGTLDDFKVTLTLPTDTKVELDPNELDNLEKMLADQVDYAPEAAIEAALNWRLDFATSADRVEDAERKVMLAADNLGAELNLIGSAGVNSTPNTRVGRLQFHEGTYTLGLEADLPLDRKAERNAYAEALISLEQQRRNFEIDQDNIELQVREALRTLAAEAEGYRIQKMALELAEDRLEAQQMLFDIGQSDVRLLLDSEGALLAAQNSVIRSLVEYTIARLSFYRDIGVLQVKPDGMWEETAQ
ncbi:MAG: TolC family protein [Phycisphaerales bacterium]|nr:MAG: TolC family protein [Phycisphaerales bacterium]